VVAEEATLASLPRDLVNVRTCACARGRLTYEECFSLQKARLARIRIAKASSGAAFVSKKKAAEARLAAQESGLDMDDTYHPEDIFELQHHHLLRCLEKTTVSQLCLMYQ
jgi:crotonobetainyl-CoA:carnitine CoA-transferase CaiB-like acyl-CoA transferase